MQQISGEKVGPYIYDRVLFKIGMPLGIRNNQDRDMPYTDDSELNFSDEPGRGVGGSKWAMLTALTKAIVLSATTP